MQNRCKMQNCLFKIKQDELCKRHWNRLRKYGNLNIVGNPVSKKSVLKNCKNEKCENLIWKNEFCVKCERRIKYRGDCNIVNPTLRKYSWNETIFEKIDKDVAWILGWLATDGSVNEKHYTISIGITDKEILEKIAKIVNYDGPIKETSPNKYKNISSYGKKPMYTICINSIIATKKLVELGIHQNKTFDLEFPKIPKEHFFSFLRGAIEGDGSIVFDKRGRLTVSINSASRKFIEQLREAIPFNSTLFVPNKHKPHVLRISWTGKNAVKLCELIYQNCGENFLTRKREKFLNYLKVKGL